MNRTPAEVMATVALLRDRSRRLTEMADELVHEFSGANGTRPTKATAAQKATTEPTRKRGNKPTSSRPGITPRKQEVINYIKAHGPSPRADFIEKGGIPRGTMATALADKSLFKQLEDGRWDVVK